MQLGTVQRTLANWLCLSPLRRTNKLMQAMTQREASRQLTGFVQIDDAYLGGEHNAGKRGRGSENKRPFVIAVATGESDRPGYAVIEPIAGFNAAAILNGPSGAYNPVLNLTAMACEADGVRWVNDVLSNLKRALDGTCQCILFLQVRASLSW